MIGCFIGFFGLRKRRERGVKATDYPKQREHVEILGENAVADAATGYPKATDLKPRGGGIKASEATVLGFDLKDLLSSSAEVLGKGSFGTTYKAILEIGRPLVVKRLMRFYASEKDFREMVDAVEKMNHENLFPLTAYYYNKDEKLLVYDYMSTGSLYALLHLNGSAGKSRLNWDTRINIAIGAAKAIAYIHSQSPTDFHGNIKSSNVLLTTTFEARVSDYGLVEYGPAKIDEYTSTTYVVDGYRAPEVNYTSNASQKADVYSFGVLFLELLTGKDPTESYLKDEGLDLTRWMVSAVNDEWTSEVFDVELLQYENVQVLLQYLELAFIWTARDPDIRPSMAQVITQIEKLGLSSPHVHETCIEVEDHKPFYVNETVNSIDC